MQFLNQHNYKYQKPVKHFVCTRLPGSPILCTGWQPDYRAEPEPEQRPRPRDGVEAGGRFAKREIFPAHP